MAITVRQAAFCGRTYMGEDQRRGRLRGQAFEIDTIPCWDRRCENAGFRTKVGVGVVTDTEAVTVVGTSSVL